MGTRIHIRDFNLPPNSRVPSEQFSVYSELKRPNKTNKQKILTNFLMFRIIGGGALHPPPPLAPSRGAPALAGLAKKYPKMAAQARAGLYKSWQCFRRMCAFSLFKNEGILIVANLFASI